MNKGEIRDIALAAGFQLKPQPSGTEDLNPYVYKFARNLLAAAGEKPLMDLVTPRRPNSKSKVDTQEQRLMDWVSDAGESR